MIINKFKKEILAAFVFVFLSGCAPREEMVAHVGRRKITVEDFKKRTEDLPHYYTGFISSEGGRRQFLSGLIKEEVLLEKSRDFDLESKPEVARELEEARRAVLLNAAVNYLVSEKIKVTDKELRDYYERNREKLESPSQIKISHILVSDENTAARILERLRRGESFARQAREHSVDTVTAIEGGDLGYLSRGELSELSPRLEEAAFNIERVGDISDIIKTPFGHHILKLTGRREGDKKEFEEMKEEIRDTLEKQKFNELIERYERELNVRIDYDILDEIEMDVNHEF